MAKEKIKLINKFFGGIVRDDKSSIQGAALNIEELDIFSNGDYFQAEQIVSADSMPANTEIYAYTSGTDGTAYGYGKETGANKIRLVSVASGGADNPGSFTTLFTSADADDLAYVISPIVFFKTDEGNTDYLYYVSNNSGTVKLWRYDITGTSEEEVGTLTGLDGSFDRISMKVMFGELMITNGQLIAKVDKEGTFTNDAFTLPNEWEAVDIIPVSDVGLILGRYTDRTVNFSKGFWWDLTAETQVDDSFNIPMGGPQWIVNHKETIKFMCAHNGIARLYQLSGAFPGSIPIELPGIRLDNIGVETATQPISSSKMISTKENILYFGLFKTDKTGIYAIGQLDNNKPNALILSKRFNTTDYSNHTPYALYILGPNYYAAYDDNGTATNVRCESNNSPNRSATGIYQSIWIDDKDPNSDKACGGLYITSYPLPATTDIDVKMASDYGSLTAITRPDGTSFTGTNEVLGYFLPKLANKKVFSVELTLISATSNSPKVTSIGLKLAIQDVPATK